MNTKGSVIVLFLCFLTLFTLTDCNTCQKHILEGESLTFKLTDRSLHDDEQLTVIKQNKVVFRKKNRKQYGPGIVKGDSLEIQHVNLSDSGTYSVEVVDVNGNNIKSYSEIVCVYAKVPKPRVNITCQDEKIDMRCDVEGDRDQISALSYSWHKNRKDLKKNVINLSVNIEVDTSKYTCTAQNPVHNFTSDPVEAACFKPETLFGFDRWFMVGLLAGGGGLVLLLIIVLLTVACRSCKHKEKQQRDEEEFRLNYVNTSHSSGPQKSKQTARGQPAPPEPYDDVSAQDVPCQTQPKPRSQQRTRPPPPPIDDEEEQPPPLPQPRKKAQVRKRDAPL